MCDEWKSHWCHLNCWLSMQTVILTPFDVESCQQHIHGTVVQAQTWDGCVSEITIGLTTAVSAQPRTATVLTTLDVDKFISTCNGQLCKSKTLARLLLFQIILCMQQNLRPLMLRGVGGTCDGQSCEWETIVSAFCQCNSTHKLQHSGGVAVSKKTLPRDDRCLSMQEYLRPWRLTDPTGSFAS